MTDPTTQDLPTSAGMYDVYLGGEHHTPTERAAAERILAMLPAVADAASANRGFLQRAVRRMVTEWGIDQFLDIGSGFPTARNTHDVAMAADPAARVVYVDIEPAVVARSAELLADVAGATVIQGDIREPERILRHPETQRLIDFTRPVGLLLVAVLHFVDDDDDPWELVTRYVAALPAGSYLALSHTSMGECLPDHVRQTGQAIYARTTNPPTDRTRTEIERFFADVQIVPPYPGAPAGVTHVGLWGAEDPDAADSDGSRMGYAAVARKL